MATFSPAGIPPRDVLLYVDEAAAASKDGPLVFYWAASESPDAAANGLGDAIASIVAAGGVVAAPKHDPASVMVPWYLALEDKVFDDLLVADEVVACVMDSIGIDTRHIHSVGFSAGALHNTKFAAYRSGYLASIVVYSGARIGTPAEQDPTNLYPAMLLHGGSTDTNAFMSFEESTLQYEQVLTDAGHASVVCNHGTGHMIPTDARDSAWKYLEDHPFGENPEPYLNELPAGFPTYCKP